MGGSEREGVHPWGSHRHSFLARQQHCLQRPAESGPGFCEPERPEGGRRESGEWK